MTRCVMIRFEFSSMIRGHHVYKENLRLLEPDNSSCNSFDSFAVAIIENDTLASRVQFLACLAAAATLWTAAYPTNLCPFLVVLIWPPLS